MLKQLKIENFTVFSKAELQFTSGLNVIVGENGCGKSHLLKLIYSIITEASAPHGKPVREVDIVKEKLEQKYINKLSNIFQAPLFGLNKKIKNQENKPLEELFDDTNSFKLDLYFSDPNLNCKLHYHAINNLKIDQTPKKWNQATPVFIPTRELLTIYPGFISIYDNYYIEFDETYRDTCVLLGAPAVKGQREKKAKEMLKPIEEAMDGKVILKNERFYLSTTNKGDIEMPMVAEGQRKLAMLAQLITTGILLDSGYLFWDEPESNLNSKLIKLIAKVILNLCNNGIQVFIASHSLFLLRELEILSQHDEFKQVESRYFALRLEDNGSVEVEQGDTLYDLQTLVLLDEQLLQSDRFMELGD